VLAVFMYTCFYDPGACLAGLLFDETTRSRKDGMIESGIAWVASFFFSFLACISLHIGLRERPALTRQRCIDGAEC
jgi:hypothetical protein